MNFDRPPRETYLRVARARVQGGSVEVGLEFCPGDNDAAMRVYLRELLRQADNMNPDTSAVGMAETVCDAIIEMWPSRAYFIESWTGGESDGWVQIFQPYGVPRNR